VSAVMACWIGWLTLRPTFTGTLTFTPPLIPLSRSSCCITCPTAFTTTPAATLASRGLLAGLIAIITWRFSTAVSFSGVVAVTQPRATATPSSTRSARVPSPSFGFAP
jgi:hypothetical protein